MLAGFYVTVTVKFRQKDYDPVINELGHWRWSKFFDKFGIFDATLRHIILKDHFTFNSSLNSFVLLALNNIENNCFFLMVDIRSES